MILEDTVRIAAEAPRVWDLLLDVDRFAACMPGVEQVTQIDDRTFDGVMLAAVGPLSGTFSFRARIIESDPPERMMAELHGTDSMTRSDVSGKMAISLHSLSTRETELAYRSTVDIQGRLAILGDMVLRATATLMLDEFFKRVRRQLEGQASELPAQKAHPDTQVSQGDKDEGAV